VNVLYELADQHFAHLADAAFTYTEHLVGSETHEHNHRHRPLDIEVASKELPPEPSGSALPDGARWSARRAQGSSTSGCRTSIRSRTT
jgi:hypothetical protein